MYACVRRAQGAEKDRDKTFCTQCMQVAVGHKRTTVQQLVSVVVVVVFTLKTVLTSIQYPSLSYSSKQRNEFPWSHANPK